MNNTILKRLKLLEDRPEGQIAKLHVEYTDGNTETLYGFSILSHLDGVRCVSYDGQHQPSVEVANLCKALCDNKTVVLKEMC